jgi:hypothetical protein
MPIGIGAAVLGAGVISAGAGLAASANAASTAQNVANENNALESQIYQSNKALETPYIQSGNAADKELQGFLGLGGNPAATKAAFDNYLKSTGYQFNYNQGLSAVNANMAAKGLTTSGANEKALEQYGTGLADEYGQQYEQNLQGLTNTGAGAANALAGEGENYAAQVSQNNNNAGSVAANAGLAAAGQVTGALSSGVNAFALSNGGSSFGGAGNAFSALPSAFGIPIGPTT